MSIVELVANKIFQECRRACYEELVIWYKNPELYFERQNGNYYMSYWGAGKKRMEVLYDLNDNRVYVYELRFVSPPYTKTVIDRSVCHDEDT